MLTGEAQAATAGLVIALKINIEIARVYDRLRYLFRQTGPSGMALSSLRSALELPGANHGVLSGEYTVRKRQPQAVYR
jgi:hypothetical protein